MAAFKRDLLILQGETWEEEFAWSAGDPREPVDLSGCAARMHVRSRVNSPEVLLELTTGNGRIVLGGASGVITLQLSAVETEAIGWLRGVYDLEIVRTVDGWVRRLLEGGVKISREVTRNG